MTLTLVAMDNSEKFIRFLDPELCHIEEDNNKDGLRTLHLEYTFQNFNEDKELFRIGNKLWVQGDENIDDCLYVINTAVEQDIYKENCFTLPLEEALVELYYAPLFSQVELNDSAFNTQLSNGEREVTVDWNALNYWFGNYFNIGVVQSCLNEYCQRVNIKGSVNRMSLLRTIEEETGNVFVTRYENDLKTNIIHRYLDFLNPINVSKDWIYNIEVEFLEGVETGQIYDSQNNQTNDNYDDVQEDSDYVAITTNGTVNNIDPDNLTFRFVTKDHNPIPGLSWIASDLGFEDNGQSAIIQISREKNTLSIDVGSKAYAVSSDSNNVEPEGNGLISISHDPTNEKNFILPDDSYFEFYDNVAEEVIYRTQVNTSIGTVHEEVLDFGFNVENIKYEFDESECYQAISPVLTASDESEGLSRTQMDSLITDWINLEVNKGDIIPMFCQRITKTSSAGTLAGAKSSMGTYNVHENYFVRPYNPKDNTSSTTATDKTYEFYKATAYWKAPFSKHAGDFHVETDKATAADYVTIMDRPDVRNPRGEQHNMKMGNVETSDDNVFNIYNAVARKLKQKQDPVVSLGVDVANLIGSNFNQYKLHDKVYVKVPDSQELITARVIKTHKEPHDIAKNSIEIENYTVTTLKGSTNETVINAGNLSFPYPSSENLAIRLENVDYDSTDEWSVQYLANQLITISIYEEDQLVRTYNKITDAYGYVNVPIKEDPGDYDITIKFGGDEEYEECSLTVDCNVYGTLEVVETPARDSGTSSKTVNKKKNKKKSKKVTKKTTVNTKTRNNISTGMNATLKKIALNIVGNSTGVAAGKKIADYVQGLKYVWYKDSKRSPLTVLKHGGNCCDKTRAMLTLMDAAGCRETLTLKYYHVCCNRKYNCGHVFAKIINNSTGKVVYVDPCVGKSYGSCWGKYLKGWGTISGGSSKNYVYGKDVF